MPFEPLNMENKQHINLSRKAWHIIEDDMQLFQIEHITSFLNRIIKNFYENADASISLSAPREIDRYEGQLHGLDKETQKNIQNILEKSFINSIEAKNAAYESCHGIKFRINNENAAYLSEECQEDAYYGTTGKYLKALFEEYCEKTYLEREKIVYKDYFDAITRAIAEKRQLKICLPNNEYVHIKPFSIETDPLSMYHYLTGYQADETDESVKSFSYRITNIKSMRQLQKKSFISKEDRHQLYEEIHKNGSQFLREKTLITKVLLTEEGRRKYNRLLHLRPRPCSPMEETKQGYLYTFDCTQQQIEYYFFKFGADAIIQSPESLRSKFKDMYARALDQYA